MKGLMAKKNGKISNNNIVKPKPVVFEQPSTVRSNKPERTTQHQHQV